MPVSVRGKNVEVTDALRDYVFKKLKKLDKYFDGDAETQATLSLEREEHRIEVTIGINGLLLRGEEQGPDMYASIDIVAEKLERQVDKYRTKIARRLRTGVTTQSVAEETVEAPQVVRTKRFPMKPMHVDEAILQMNLLGHSFYVFTNAESELVNVVYRRRDGNFGLIEPQV